MHSVYSWRAAIAALALVLPWLNPIATGPSAAVLPWLASAAAACMAVFLVPGRVPPFVAAFMGVLLAWSIVRSGLSLDEAALAGGLLLIAFGAAAGSGLRAAGRVDLVAWGWLAAALASTAMALAQYFGVASWLSPLVSLASPGEAYANLRQRNQFASLTVIGFGGLLWLCRNRAPTAGPIAGAVLLAAGNAAAGSRTGLMALALVAVIVRLWPGRSRSQAALALVGLLAYAVAALLLPWALQGVSGVEGPSLWRRVAATDPCSSRAVLWSNVLHLIAQRPLAGWGWGELDFAHFATLYRGARFCDILDNAHNLPLHIAVELGLPAAALACLLVAVAVLRLRPWAEADATRQLGWLILLVIGLHSLLEYPLWYGPFQIALGVGIGLIAGAPTRPARAGAVRLVAMGFAGALAFAAWDYQRVSQIYLAPEARLPVWREDTLEHVRQSRLFASPAAFAELTLSPLSRANAEWNYAQGRALLHYSPEPRIIERVIEGATLLERDDEALWYLVRYRAAFPQAHAEWTRALGTTGDQGAR